MITPESTPCALEETAAAERDKSEAEQRSICNTREEPAAIHTMDTTSVFHTVSLLCQRAMANTGPHRVQFQTVVPAKRGESVKKSPSCSIYYHAYYPEPNQGTNTWPLVIFQNFAYAVLSPQDCHQDKARGRCHFFHHYPSREGACSRTRERTRKWLTRGKICLWPRKV